MNGLREGVVRMALRAGFARLKGVVDSTIATGTDDDLAMAFDKSRN
jgi:hypothetical protein